MFYSANNGTNLQREGGHQGLWELPRHRDDISYHEDLGANNRQKNEGADTILAEEQFGFMPGRGTTDAIFAARQVMEKHREMQKELHVFIDLEMYMTGFHGRMFGGVSGSRVYLKSMCDS